MTTGAMTAEERLLAVLAGKPVDRPPVSLYEIDGFSTRYSPDHPSYRRIRDFVRRHCDNMVMEMPDIPGPLGFLFTGCEEGTVRRETSMDGPDEVTVTTIETPKGPLSTTTRRNADAYTVWTTEFLVKDAADAERLLSLEYIPAQPSMERFEAVRGELHGRGIMMPDIHDPMVMAATVMEFNTYMLLMTLERKTFRALLDMFAGRVHDWLDAVLAMDGGPLFRIVGPELCTPPYMPPELFREFVVDYDTPFIEKIHRAGKFARLHSHGNIAKVADMIIGMEPDALDPLEEPPGGDMAFDEAVRLLGPHMCLMGNIQEAMFELHTPEEVAAETRRILDIGAPSGRFVLMPTATPITVPLPSRVEECVFAFLETGLSGS